MNNEPETHNNLENTPAADTPVPNSFVTPYSSTHLPPNNSKKRKVIILTIVLAVLLIGAGAIYWFGFKDKKPSASKDQPATATTKPEVSQKEVDAALAKFINPTTGETWLATPKKIAGQGYLKDPEGEKLAEYYEVGKRGGKTVQISVVQDLGDNISLYERAVDGSVTLIARPDGDAVYNEDNEKYFGETYSTKVTVNKTTHYDSLTIPRQIDLDRGYKLSKPTYPSLGDLIRPTDNTPKSSEVRKLGSSSLKKSEGAYADTKLTSIAYYLQTPLNTTISLTYEPLETSLTGYQWQSGASPTDTLRAISRGCGGRFSAVTRSDSVTDADIQQIGKSPSGQVVYELKNIDHPLLQKAYEEFKDFNKDYPEAEYASISKADFAKEHAVVIYKDKFGQYLVFIREKLAAIGGCAKPVVYLYPSQTTSVNVKVGAEVKVSDPLYNPASGWKNVIASPSGSLVYNGQAYESLFWEGPGIGAYPSITTGTIVKSSEAAATIRSQLTQLGLNSKEINDFEIYWKDRLPTNKPYVRLTWLTTADLNQLAPLYITPKPDTLIRVFLDFSGLDTPIKLTPQQLSSIPRKGFTVVEWGGLSTTRLY
jgi:hypothetical protein